MERHLRNNYLEDTMNLERFQPTDLKKINAAWALTSTTAPADPRASAHSKDRNLNAPQSKPNGLRQEQKILFDDLLVDMLARFINLPINEVDSEIEQALNHVCKALGVEWGELWLTSTQQSSSFILTHHYVPERRPAGPKESGHFAASGAAPGPGAEVVTIPIGTESKDLFPYATATLRRGEIIVASRIEDL